MFPRCMYGCRTAMLAAALAAAASGASPRAAAQRPEPVAVRAADSAAAKHRSPLIAGFLGVLPGVGHVYAGETGRGLTVAGVWFGSGMVMFSGADRVVTSVAAVVNIATYVFSIADAALAAERFNARHGGGTPHAE